MLFQPLVSADVEIAVDSFDSAATLRPSFEVFIDVGYILRCWKKAKRMVASSWCRQKYGGQPTKWPSISLIDNQVIFFNGLICNDVHSTIST